MAERVLSLESEAADIRERLGLHGAALARIVSPTSGSPLAVVMARTIFEIGGRPMMRSQAYGARWRALEDEAAVPVGRRRSARRAMRAASSGAATKGNSQLFRRRR